MAEPLTESGRALLAKEDYAMPEDIIAIEQEAASAAVAEERCPWCGHPPMCHKGEGECAALIAGIGEDHP